jgi:hypothetical protein
MSPLSSPASTARRTDRSHLRLVASDEPAADAPPSSCDRDCDHWSAYFISGPGWAWRVTAALTRERRARSAAAARPA